MDLLFGPTSSIVSTTTTVAPMIYGPLLNDGLVAPYKDSFGVASVIARDMTLALFVMMATYSGRQEYPEALWHCDFEDGWCPGFEHTDRGDMPWTLNRGSTRSNLTGPEHDHTRFNEYGTYAYVEASGKKSGETAVFRTSTALMLDKPHYCFSFWYNMFGSGMGSLWIFWNAAGDEGIHKVVDKHAGEKSDNGTHWRRSLTTLTKTSVRKFYRPVWFEFRGIRGGSFKSDMAVDDILLQPGKCEDIPLSRTATTMTFRGITTQPPTTTPLSWKASHPDWRRCGEEYAHVRKETCCADKVRPNRGYLYQCCSTKLFHMIHNFCCGGAVLWVNTHGCCGGSRIYTKRVQGCCGHNSVYRLDEEKCVDNNRLVPLNITSGSTGTRPRGKRSIELA